MYLSGSEYNTEMNDIAGQLLELGKDLKTEILAHKRAWARRYEVYRGLFGDVGQIDFQLRELVQPSLAGKPKLLAAPRKTFVQIHELQK